jgi:hypothetical protein
MTLRGPAASVAGREGLLLPAHVLPDPGLVVDVHELDLAVLAPPQRGHHQPAVLLRGPHADRARLWGAV